MPGISPSSRQALSPFALSLSPARLFDAVAAIRGPDLVLPMPMPPKSNALRLERIKYIVTGRIRTIVFRDTGPAVFTLFPITEDEITEIRSIVLQILKMARTTETSIGVNHFLRHLEEAVMSTADHPIWAGLPSRVSAALRGQQ